MEPAQISPELAAQHRLASLLAKFCEGADLTPAQLDELRTAYPGLDASPSPPISVAVHAEVSHRTAKLTKADEQRYSALYKKGWRQIRRWVEKGEKSGDPCPLNDPRALMAWWPRHNTWRVPPEIEEAAIASAIAPKNSVAPPASPVPSDREDIPQIPAPQTTMVQTGAGKSIDLENFDPEEGDRLRELKQIQSAKFAQLKDALKDGQDCTLLESKYLKLSETIDKIESRVTERLKKRGLYILREAVERDLAAGAELFRQSGESMKRRVLELCPSLTAEQRAEVAAAIDVALQSQARVFSRLDSLNYDDLLRELTA